MPIGVFDSGLGGLSVLKALKTAMPDQAFVYFGDNAHAPYGTREPGDILAKTCAALDILWRDCDLVILACNTASAIALRPIQTAGVPYGKNVLGVFVPMIEALAERPWGDTSPPSRVSLDRVALFATPATVASGAFERELDLRAQGIQVTAQACPELVDAIEAGDRARSTQLVNQYVAALKETLPEPQAAALGCTHYPWVAADFQSALGAEVRLISQPDLIAASLADYLIRHQMPRTAGGDRFLTTGDCEAVSRQASQFWGSNLPFESAL